MNYDGSDYKRIPWLAWVIVVGILGSVPVAVFAVVLAVCEVVS